MDEIRVDAADFTLVSRWKVVTGSNGVKEVTEGPSTATNTVTFAYDIPSLAKVQRARVHSTWGDPLSGYALRTVNGVTPDADGMVDVEIDTSQSSIAVVFSFRANGNTTSTGDRSGAASVSEVYLLIETKGGSGYLYRLENNELVPYKFHRVESGALVPYLLMCTLEPTATTVSQLYTAGGEAFYTADGQYFKALGGTT